MAPSGDINYAAVLHSKNDLRVEEVSVPDDIPPGHVKLGMRAVGICGSDVHFWKHGCIGPFMVKAPMVLGHEGSGEVLAVGAGVNGLEPGDRVAIEPGVPCGSCESCATGRYNLCADVKFAATPPTDGSLANYVVHPARFCFKLPDSVSYEEAAMLEPLSVAIHSCRRANVQIGHKVFIAGAGPIGLMCMLVARAAGATSLTLADIDPYRLSVAAQHGADDVLLVDGKEETQKKVNNMNAHVCFEACGMQAATNMCIEAARRGGVVVLVGVGKPTMEVPLLEAACKEVDIRGVFRYCNTWPSALSLVASGRVNLNPFVTHRYKLTSALEAFETASNKDSKSIKVIVDCSPSEGAAVKS